MVDTYETEARDFMIRNNIKKKYMAYITGGIIIYGNSISALVLVRWGDGHSARIKLEEERKS